MGLHFIKNGFKPVFEMNHIVCVPVLMLLPAFTSISSACSARTAKNFKLIYLLILYVYFVSS